MAINSNFVKEHWKILAGGFAGLLLLFYLFKHGQSSAATSSGTTDLSGGAAVNQNLSAAASLTNAQTNAQIEIAAYQQGTANNAIQAQLAASLADTAGKVTVAQAETAAGLVASLDKNASVVSVQRLQSEQAIQQTALQGETVIGLAHTVGQTQVQIQQAKNAVDLAGIGLQTHIYDTLASQHKLGGNSEGVSKIVSSIFGRGPEAIAATQPSDVASSPGAIIGGIGSIVKGLFG